MPMLEDKEAVVVVAGAVVSSMVKNIVVVGLVQPESKVTMEPPNPKVDVAERTAAVMVTACNNVMVMCVSIGRQCERWAKKRSSM
jgi:hypothetical protein